MFLPRALSATTDAQNAMVRLVKIFRAPLVEGDPYVINPDQKFAVEVRGATFEWEEGASVKEAREQKERKTKGKRAEKSAAPTPQPNTAKEPIQDVAPFQVVDVDMLIPRGSLVAVVGQVGSGKVSDTLFGLDESALTSYTFAVQLVAGSDR